MTDIRSILSHMTFWDFVRAAEAAERERLADEHLAKMRRKKGRQPAEEAARCAAMGRPEYLYEKNAAKREDCYQKHVAFENWEAEKAEERRRKHDGHDTDHTE